MVRVMRAGFLVGTAMFIAACSQSDQYLQFSNGVDVPGFVEAAIDGERSWTRQRLTARLGEPVKTIEDGATLRVEYYGFYVVLEGDSLAHIIYTTSRHIAPGRIRVGFSVDQVRRLWGPPLSREGTRWTYRTEVGNVDLILEIEEEAVSSIEWRFPSGR